MLSKLEIIDLLKAKKQYLAKNYGVSGIALFGSYASDNATENSDVDLVLDFFSPIGFRFYNVIEDLEAIFNKKVDVLTRAGIDSIRSEKIKKNILETMINVS
jgi:uncharacterized protein